MPGPLDNRTPASPTIFVIFGATGDLSERKLIPALFDLYRKKLLPSKFKIVGFARRNMSDEEFREFALDALRRKNRGRAGAGALRFLRHLHFLSGAADDPFSYERLAEALIRIDEHEFKACSNKLFYLAVPPSLYEIIFQNLAHSGLTIPCGGSKGWTRILVEKPFGRDLATAQKLDKDLGLLFKEEQVFRIDHYLAKETLQNILAFRFSNSLFEPVWNADHIERVEIRLWETAGVGKRGSFYEDIGALRDVGQNHLLQMLALVAMDHPAAFDAFSIRSERANILASLKKFQASEKPFPAIRGQYKGYRVEEPARAQSSVETYFRLAAFIGTERWKGVPFILESGKKMKENNVEISVFFKPNDLVPGIKQEGDSFQNILTFKIQPEEGIALCFFAKKAGVSNELEKRMLSFSYKYPRRSAVSFDAYERLLYDCIRGDQTLFASTREVAAAWEFITPILEGWKNTKLEIYEEGWEGPEK